MDIGRVKDIERLQAVLDNPNKSYAVKQIAARTKAMIIRQSKDKGLLELRSRLIKAVQAQDEEYEWRIGMQIKDYMHEQKLDKPT